MHKKYKWRKMRIESSWTLGLHEKYCACISAEKINVLN